MNLKEKINEHWKVFITIEDDIIKIFKYVHFDKRNYNAYSIELSKVLIFVCSEIESIYKIFSNEVFSKSINNIIDFKKNLNLNQDQMKSLENFSVKLGESQEIIKPWEGFSSHVPSWWKAYNNLKHEYIDNLKEGNLINVLRSTAGLFALLVTLQILKSIDIKNNQVIVMPSPRFFKSDKIAINMRDVVMTFTESGALEINSFN